jgi:predicted dehydrogenase
MEYDGLEVLLVRFDNGAVGKVSVNADCVLPYTFPVRILGDRGTVFDHRVWAPSGAGPAAWTELAEIRPDSSDVSHHPFQAEIDHFVGCLRRDEESHCNLEDAVRTHEVVFAALECYRTRRPVALPLLDGGA